MKGIFYIHERKYFILVEKEKSQLFNQVLLDRETLLANDPLHGVSKCICRCLYVLIYEFYILSPRQRGIANNPETFSGARSLFYIKGPLIPQNHVCNYSWQSSGWRRATGLVRHGERRWWEKRSSGRTRRHHMVEVNSVLLTPCHWATTASVWVCICVQGERGRVWETVWNKCTLTDVAFRLLWNTGTGASAQIHSRKSLLDHRIAQERQIAATACSFHTLPCTLADKLFPQKRSAGRSWSGTINFTLVLPASKACWSECRIWWHRDTYCRL